MMDCVGNVSGDLRSFSLLEDQINLDKWKERRIEICREIWKYLIGKKFFQAKSTKEIASSNAELSFTTESPLYLLVNLIRIFFP